MPIKVSLSSTDVLSVPVDVAVIGVPEGASLRGGVLGQLSKALGPNVAKTLKREEFVGKRDRNGGRCGEERGFFLRKSRDQFCERQPPFARGNRRL